MDTQWRPTTRYLVGIGLAIFGLYVLYISRSILPLLIIAGLIAFLVRPAISFLHYRLKIPWSLSVLITYLVATILIILAPLILVPPVVSAVRFLLELDYQALIDSSLTWLEQRLQTLKANDLAFLGVRVELDNLIDPMLISVRNAEPSFTPELPSLTVIANSLGSAFTVSYGVAVGVVGTVFSGVVAFVFMILSAIYLSLDSHRLYSWFLGTVPEVYRPEIAKLLRRLRRTWELFFRGQVTLMVFIGVLVWLGGTALGLPGAFALGVIAGLLEIVPNLGPVLAAIPAVIVALLQGSSYLDVNNFVFALIIIGFYFLVNGLENNFIVPRVLGEAVDLHPVVVFAGVLVGATIWGILGALLAAPVIASAREIIRYLYLKMQGADPFPPEDEVPKEQEVSWGEMISGFKTKFQTFIQREPDVVPTSADTEPETGEE